MDQTKILIASVSQAMKPDPLRTLKNVSQKLITSDRPGPTERAGPAVKKARVASDGGYRGVPKGGMGGKGGGGGAAGRRSYSSY